MSDDDAAVLPHEDPSSFLAALRAAEARTHFSARLIEKDYYCSLVLLDLTDAFEQGLVFKGGTSLSKVHAEFFRLSEDLDFAVSISSQSRQSERRNAAAPVKVHFAGLPGRVPCFREATALTGFNSSRQYNGDLCYHSVITREEERLKVEVALREQVIVPAVMLPARTLLTDPMTQTPLLPPVQVRVLTPRETYAEKVRAALTRRSPAIRDFFDIHNAVERGALAHTEPAVQALIARKLEIAIESGEPVDLSAGRIAALRDQIEAHLKPVLREDDYQRFNLERVLIVLEEVVALCTGK
jgi:predicted nucleotidyltransferase component of viral defense system